MSVGRYGSYAGLTNEPLVDADTSFDFKTVLTKSAKARAFVLANRPVGKMAQRSIGNRI
jgi:hypothetical protein